MNTVQTITKKDVTRRAAKLAGERIYLAEKVVDGAFEALHRFMSEADPEVRIEIRDFIIYQLIIYFLDEGENNYFLDFIRRNCILFLLGSIIYLHFFEMRYNAMSNSLKTWRVYEQKAIVCIQQLCFHYIL